MNTESLMTQNPDDLASRILKETNTDWTVSKRPLFGPDKEPTDVFGIFRDDTGNFLGSVKKKYQITQNFEILDMLLEAAANLNISVSRGGTLGNGAKVYYQLKLEKVRIGGSDNLRYLTALTSHDASTRMGFGTTNVTVVCQNTFYRALQEVTQIKHTATGKERIKALAVSLNESLISEYRMIEQLIEMSTLEVPTKLSDEFLGKLLGINVADEMPTRRKNIMSQVKEALHTELNTHGENAYALFNMVTRYTNHIVNYHNTESKRQAIMMGNAFRTVNHAMDVLYHGAKQGNLQELVMA
jgi:phage/plasmid-like protein (TIGR03299 family)